MKKNRWGILITLSVTSFLLCSFILSSCRPVIPDVIESLMSDTAATSDIPDSGKYADYKNLFAEYKTANKEYFKNTENAINSIMGQKYGYGITAYEHGDDLAEIAEMFFDENSAARLDMYFALRGYDDRSYKEEENAAEFTAKKKDDDCSYKVSYNAEDGRFEIIFTVNGEIQDSLLCVLTDDDLVKCCYSGTIDRTFISRVSRDGKSEVEWFDRMITDPAETEANEERGNVSFNGEMLSGKIK